MVITQNLKENIAAKLKTQDLVRIPASASDYLSVAHDLPFKIEYHQSEIVTMGLASYWHEAIVMTLGGIFYNLFIDKDEYTVLGSNAGVHIPKFEGGYYMPDVMVVKGKPIFKPNSTAIITNPYIIVEVLSPSTRDFDLSEKQPEYKHLESLQQLIYINPKKMNVSSFIRSQNPDVWLNQDFYEETHAVSIDNTPVLLKDIYRKVQFEK
jgi:Uma2 family endonuclease